VFSAHAGAHAATISYLQEQQLVLVELLQCRRFRIGLRARSRFLFTVSTMLSFLLLAVAANGCNEGLAPALSALQQNDPAKAKSILSPLQKQCLESSSYYELLGAANGMAGDSVAAEIAFKTAASLEPKSSRLQAELGAAYLRNRKPQLASEALARALALDPSNQAAAKYLLASYVELKDWPHASALFDHMGADKSPGILRDPLLVFWFAQTLIETNHAGSIDDLLAPDQPVMTPPLLFSLGTLFAEHRMYRTAVKYLRTIPKDKADDAVYFNLGLAYSHLRDFDQARECYFKAIDQHPGHVYAYFRVGLDYASEGDTRKSIPWLIRAHNGEPANPEIAYALAEQLLLLEYVDTTAQILQKASEVNPSHPLLMVAEGDLQQARGDTSAAIDTYKKALALQPTLVAALVALSRAYVKQGNDAEARQALNSALSKDPSDPPANAELGLLEARNEEWILASEHLEKAWGGDRSNTRVALALARAYGHMNHPEDAVRLLTPLSSSLHDSSAFHLQLAQLYTQLQRPTDAQAERDAVTAIQAHEQSELRFESAKTYIY
jgi:Flp pilus assembly protein TadD